MSLVKTGAVQVGQSATASNNFHWRNLLDGVLRLTRGNAGSPIADVMLVKADNSVGFPGGVSSGVLGAGQSWQDVKTTPGRVSGTSYTNTTGRPIIVKVTTGGSTTTAVAITVSGVLVESQSTSDSSALSASSGQALVPHGATYSVAVTGGISIWTELR